MSYELKYSDRATKGQEKILKSGDQGLIKAMNKQLAILAVNPKHPSLQSHKMSKPNKFGNRDDLFISYIRTGGGERIVWAHRVPGGEVQIIDIEYLGPHIG